MRSIVDTNTRPVTLTLERLCVSHSAHLKRKDAVRLTFRLPTSHALVDAAGAVVWVSDRRYGIRFNYIGDRSQESIRQFIEQQIGN